MRQSIPAVSVILTVFGWLALIASGFTATKSNTCPLSIPESIQIERTLTDIDPESLMSLSMARLNANRPDCAKPLTAQIKDNICGQGDPKNVQPVAGTFFLRSNLSGRWHTGINNSNIVASIDKLCQEGKISKADLTDGLHIDSGCWDKMINAIPESEGVYLFQTADNRYYVGQTGNLRNRIKQHLWDGNIHPGLFSTIQFGNMSGEDHRLHYETAMIYCMFHAGFPMKNELTIDLPQSTYYISHDEGICGVRSLY